MHSKLFAAMILTVATLGFTAATAQETGPAKISQSSLGAILTDASGMTLYTFTRDMTGYSNCNAQCAVDWPPFLAAATDKSAGDWSIIIRDDGKKQWGYKGAALYHWSKDSKPGETTGDGAAKGKWHAAKP
jgi:predicted lipoprotein with Yx(FWY)xxD motif